MKKNIKKFVSVALILVLILSLASMVACKKKPANNDDKTARAINAAGADALIKWLSTAEAVELIREYGPAEGYGEALFTPLDTAPKYTGEIAKATDQTRVIKLGTTTSVNDSGLLPKILQTFETKYGYKVEVASAGTGAAIASAEAGNADLILVHSKKSEEAFVAGGFARKVDGVGDSERISFMKNYFVIVGPNANPAGIGTSDADASDAFIKIFDNKDTSKFVSRGDKSGTHDKEVSIWNKAYPDLNMSNNVAELPASFTPAWYISKGGGMGVSLTMANEKEAYILSDKATYLRYKNDKDGDKIPNLTLIYEGGASMLNTYTLIAVNPNAKFTVI